ncbi:N-acetyltransferase ESCO2 [Periplaneta americana]|uniref:N-acetyltransferase ESCO2 n=1 Tax=Periplaneta americana TaxID=6978 RepID=UPI0037E82B66
MMATSLVEEILDKVDITPPKSARKRIVFTESPKDENSDSTLGHMSPLESSPDRYSSPPPSPQWLMETPPKRNMQHWLNQSPFGPIQNKTEVRRSPRLSRYEVHTSSLAKSPQMKTPRKNSRTLEKRKIGQVTDIELSIETPMKTPHKDNKTQEKCKLGPITDLELVEESPMKDSSQMRLMTPFKRLGGKAKITEETPKQKSQILVVSETPDVNSPAAPVKLLQRMRPDDEPVTVLKSVHTNAGVCKFSSLPASSFYQTSRARASLFSEPLSKPVRFVPAYSSSQKRKRSLSNDSFRPYKRYLPSSRNKKPRRLKLGEINAGVRHKIQKPKKKITKKQYPADCSQPKVTPEDRIVAYLDKLEPLVTEIQSHINSQANNLPSDDSTEKDASAVAEAESETPSPPPTPLPDPSKKFFKYGRTSKLNSRATITVNNNIKLKVSNGKFSLNRPGGKPKTPKSQQVEKSEAFEPIGIDKSTAEAVQDSVHDNIAMLLQQLEQSPEKEPPPVTIEDMQSPNHNISAITSSTSSLAIDDEPKATRSSSTSNENEEVHFENSQADEGGYLFVDPPCGEDVIPDTEKENENKKYFSIFYKSPASKKFTDVTNVKRPRGVKRPWKSIGENQYIIDAGQKRFGVTQCKECGIVYHIGDPQDEMSHQKYHDQVNSVTYSAWKQERVVAHYGLERVILVKPTDSKSWLNKVKDVLEMVDKELGYADTGLASLAPDSHIYLYVANKKVFGCVVAHPITLAYKMLDSVVEGCDCCSAESYPAKCGVSRVWVNKNHRRRKVASRLLDCMRANFVHGYILGKDEFAFSAPTPEGKALAEKYTGTVNYLVYT